MAFIYKDYGNQFDNKNKIKELANNIWSVITWVLYKFKKCSMHRDDLLASFENKWSNQ